jgi:hypothetical protein
MPEGTVITEVREPSGILSVGKGLSRKGKFQMSYVSISKVSQGSIRKNRLDLPKNSNSSHVDRLVGNKRGDTNDGPYKSQGGNNGVTNAPSESLFIIRALQHNHTRQIFHSH